MNAIIQSVNEVLFSEHVREQFVLPDKVSNN
jgi:hypothetical protein